MIGSSDVMVSFVILRDNMLNVVILSVVMLSVVMLCVVMLCVIMLSVVAPKNRRLQNIN
jgi:hypothetical protein